LIGTTGVAVAAATCVGAADEMPSQPLLAGDEDAAATGMELLRAGTPL